MCGAMPVLRHALEYREQEQLFVLLRHLAVNLVSFHLISMFRKQARLREGWGLQTSQSKFKQDM